MPYRSKKKWGQKSSRRYRKRGATRGQVYGAAAGQLYKDVRMLKDLINVEFKFHDVASSGTITDAGTDLFLLNGVASGDDANSRDGRQIRIKSLQSNFVFTKHASATATNIRIMLFIDKQPNEAAPTAAQVLQSVGMVSPRNLNYRKRFVILKDMCLKLNADYPEKQVKLYRKLDMKTVFDATGGTIADITTNSLYLLLIGDESVNDPTVVQYNRIRFIDN